MCTSYDFNVREKRINMNVTKLKYQWFEVKICHLKIEANENVKPPKVDCNSEKKIAREKSLHSDVGGAK